VIDMIASDTMGQMPDRTIADAVRRLPGVSVERAAGQGENEYVSIRGMNSDFNKITIDGMPITVSNFDGASRSVPLNVISSEVANTIEVTKAATPEMDGDAIGGTINIRTKNAFDYGGRHASASFTMGYAENIEDYSGKFPHDNYFPSFSFTYSDFIGESDTLGYSISANYRERVFVTSDVSTGGYFLDTVSNSYLPEALNIQEFYNDIKEWGMSSSLDWRPDLDTMIRLSYSFSRKDDNNGRHRISYFNDFDSAFNTVTETRGDTATRFDYDGFVDKQVREFMDRQDVHVLNLVAEKQLEEWTLSSKIGLNRSEYTGSPAQDLIGTISQGGLVFGFDYDSTGDPYTPQITNPGFDINDPANYDFLLTANSSTREITDEEFLVGADAEREATLFDLPVKIKFGAKARLRERDFEDINENYEDGGLLASEVEGLVADYSVKSRVDGAYDGGFLLDPDAFRDLVNGLAGSGIILQELDDGLLDALNSYNSTEDIYAAYAQGTMEFGKFTVLGGLRMEYTQVEFNGNEVDFDTATISSLQADNDYVNFLPGLHVRYDATDKFIVRGSVNRSIARPSYRQLNPSTRIDPGEANNGGDLIERGNIDLDPTESWNLDLGFDYYYSDAGYVSLGAFAKYMKNNIYQFNTDVGPDQLIETRNAEDAEVYGIEFAVDQRFDFLPGILSNFGTSLNLTFVDSEVETGILGRDKVRLFGQVDRSANLAVYYRDDKFRARLSYNWTGDQLAFNGLNVDPNLDTFIDEYGTLDFTTGYSITENFEIFFEAQNITNESSRAYDGSKDRLTFNSYQGSSYFVGVNWNL